MTSHCETDVPSGSIKILSASAAAAKPVAFSLWFYRTCWRLLITVSFFPASIEILSTLEIDLIRPHRNSAIMPHAFRRVPVQTWTFHFDCIVSQRLHHNVKQLQNSTVDVPLHASLASPPPTRNESWLSPRRNGQRLTSGNSPLAYEHNLDRDNCMPSSWNAVKNIESTRSRNDRRDLATLDRSHASFSFIDSRAIRILDRNNWSLRKEIN